MSYSKAEIERTPLPPGEFKKSDLLGTVFHPWRVVVTADEFKKLQPGDVLLEYGSMRHWTVIGNTTGVVAIQTTRLLPNPSGIELEGWRLVGKDAGDPPPF